MYYNYTCIYVYYVTIISIYMYTNISICIYGYRYRCIDLLWGWWFTPLWRLRRADQTQESQFSQAIPVPVQRAEKQKSWWYNFQSGGRRRLRSQLKDSEAEREWTLPYSFFVALRSRMDRIGPVHLGEGNLFAQSTNSDANLIQKHLQTHLE